MQTALLAALVIVASGCAKTVDPQWREVVAALPDGIKLDHDSTPTRLDLVLKDSTPLGGASRVRDVLLAQGWMRVDDAVEKPDAPHVTMTFVKQQHGVFSLDCFGMKDDLTCSMTKSYQDEAQALASLRRAKLSDAEREAAIASAMKPLGSILSQFEAGLKAPRFCSPAVLAAVPKTQLGNLRLVDYDHAAGLAGLRRSVISDNKLDLLGDVEHLADVNPARYDAVVAAAERVAPTLASLKIAAIYRIRSARNAKVTTGGFTGGSASGELVLVEAPSGRPLCSGQFSASSSDTVTVTSRNGRADAHAAVRHDLDYKLHSELVRAVSKMSPQLSLGSNLRL